MLRQGKATLTLAPGVIFSPGALSMEPESAYPRFVASVGKVAVCALREHLVHCTLRIYPDRQSRGRETGSPPVFLPRRQP